VAHSDVRDGGGNTVNMAKDPKSKNRKSICKKCKGEGHIRNSKGEWSRCRCLSIKLDSDYLREAGIPGLICDQFRETGKVPIRCPSDFEPVTILNGKGSHHKASWYLVQRYVKHSSSVAGVRLWDLVNAEFDKSTTKRDLTSQDLLAIFAGGEPNHSWVLPVLETLVMSRKRDGVKTIVAIQGRAHWSKDMNLGSSG